MQTATPCKFWTQKGFCKNKDQCPFYHGAAATKPMCTFFASRGYCRNGESCPFLHERTTPPAKTPQSPIRPGFPVARSTGAKLITQPSQPCIFFSRTGACRNGAQCTFTHVTPSSPSTVTALPVAESDVCAYWTAGQCRFGDKCMRSHPQTTLGNLSTAAAVPSQTQPQDPPTRIPCRFWKMGECAKGDACPFTHNAEDIPTDLNEQNGVSRHMLFSAFYVDFSAGLNVDKIIPSFESHRLVLRNLAIHTQKKDLEDHFVKCGFAPGSYSVFSVRPSADTTRSEAIVTLDESEGSDHALVELEHSTLSGLQVQVVKTSTGGRGQMNATSFADGNTITVSWFAPSKVAFGSCFNEQEAIRKAESLNHRRLRGRQVVVTSTKKETSPMIIRGRGSFYSRSIIKTQWSIKIVGIPLETTEAEVEGFCRLKEVTLLDGDEDSDDAFEQLDTRVQYSCKASLVDVQRNRVPDATGIVSAKLRYETWEAAKKAADSLSSYFSSRRISLPTHYRFSMTIPAAQYKVQSPLFKALSGSGRDDEPSVVVFEQPGNPFVKVKVMGNNKKSVGSCKTKVEKIVAGEIFQPWNSYFITPEGKTFIQQVQKATNSYIHVDRRAFLLRLYGETEEVPVVRTMLETKLDSICSDHLTVTIPRRSIRFFLSRGVSILAEMAGEDNVRLDIGGDPSITVTGGERIRHRLNQLVQESFLDTSDTDNAPGGPSHGECPACLDDDISNPIELTCGHSYCNGCLEHYLRSATSTRRFPIVCVGNEGACKHPIPMPTMRKFLTEQQMKTLLETVAQQYLNERPDQFQFCATGGCNQIYRLTKTPTFLECPSCLATMCTACKSESHDGFTCADWKKHKSPEESERLLQQWVESNTLVKRCPKCQVYIEKNDGCNHMTCKCGAHICWKCMKVFPQGSIYSHLEREHGGAFDIPNSLRY